MLYPVNPPNKPHVFEVLDLELWGYPKRLGTNLSEKERKLCSVVCAKKMSITIVEVCLDHWENNEDIIITTSHDIKEAFIITHGLLLNASGNSFVEMSNITFDPYVEKMLIPAGMLEVSMMGSNE